MDDLQIFTENYAPYNYEREGQAVGLSVDVLLAMFERLETRQSRSDIQVFPWARAYTYAKSGPNVMLFVMTRTPAREPLFKWVGPIIDTTVGVLGKRRRDFRIHRPGDLRSYRIGAIHDDIGQLSLLEQGVRPKNIHVVAVPRVAARMLSADRIDLWAYEKNVSLWYLREVGAVPQDYEMVYTLRQSELYFALSPDTSDAIIDTLQTAFDAVKSSGTLDDIIQRRIH